MEERCAWLEAQGKLLEAHRLRQRTQYDMEMLREMGCCNGIENYSRILLGKEPGATPNCLLDYFPDDFLCFLDESHMSLPQIREPFIDLSPVRHDGSVGNCHKGDLTLAGGMDIALPQPWFEYSPGYEVPLPRSNGSLPTSSVSDPG